MCDLFPVFRLSSLYLKCRHWFFIYWFTSKIPWAIKARVCAPWVAWCQLLELASAALQGCNSRNLESRVEPELEHRCPSVGCRHSLWRLHGHSSWRLHGCVRCFLQRLISVACEIFGVFLSGYFLRVSLSGQTVASLLGECIPVLSLSPVTFPS